MIYYKYIILLAINSEGSERLREARQVLCRGGLFETIAPGLLDC